jgi:hypothetical protein
MVRRTRRKARKSRKKRGGNLLSIVQKALLPFVLFKGQRAMRKKVARRKRVARKKSKTRKNKRK